MAPSKQEFTPEEFRERLVMLRKWNRLSQEELTERAGLGKTAVSQFETGRRAPSLPNLLKLVSVLRSPAYLFGQADVPEPVQQGEV
jgi:transcriptional regulator with XRE-family HTH domain